jgi:hypothetical protein
MDRTTNTETRGSAIPGSEDAAWGTLYRVGAAAALGILVLTPIAAIVFVAVPPPSTVLGFFTLFRESRWLGLLSLDLVYMIAILLSGLLTMVLCVALRRANPSLIAIAAFFNLAATSMYVASNPAFEMLTLSGQHATATSETQRQTFVAAGETMLAIYTGTAYNVSYIMAAVAGLLVALAMLRSGVFGKVTAYLGVGMNTLGLVPPTVGTLGMVAALLFLAPLMIWLVLVARRLTQLGREPPPR